MAFIIPYFVFVFSWMPMEQPPDMTIRQDIFVTEVTIGAEIFDLLHVEGDTNITMAQGNIVNYMPLQSEFYIRAFLEYKGFFIGVEHACFHPIEADMATWQYEGGYDKVYLKFDSRAFK